MTRFAAAAAVLTIFSLPACPSQATDYQTAFPPVATPGGQTVLIYPDMPVELLVTEKQTAGQFGMVVIYTKPGEGPDANMVLEPKLTETFYVLDGTFRFTQGDASFDGGVGTVVVSPPTLPHGFKNIGEGVGRLLVLYTPSDGPRKGVDFFVDWAAQSTRSPEWIAKKNAEYGIDRPAP